MAFKWEFTVTDFRLSPTGVFFPYLLTTIFSIDLPRRTGSCFIHLEGTNLNYRKAKPMQNKNVLRPFQLNCQPLVAEVRKYRRSPAKHSETKSRPNIKPYNMILKFGLFLYPSRFYNRGLLPEMPDDDG